MKRIIFAVLMALVMMSSYAATPGLKFGKDGKFKIVQFTDLHIVHEDERSNAAFECIKNVVEAEKPDLIMLTGDIIYGKPGDANFKNVVEFVSKFKIPFGITFGNHDYEQDFSNADLMAIARSSKWCVADDAGGITGVGNYVLEVKSAAGKNDALLLYCFDSNNYSKLDGRGVGGYDHIRLDQINWYAQKSKSYTGANGGEPLPALAFFHIPLPEYAEASTSPSAQMYGARREKVCSPPLNSGLFTAFKEQGDVMGMFVGHDHDNDFAVSWYGVMLAYGRYSGGNTVYNHLPNGARVIELTEGQRSFTTWIRLRTGEIEQKTNFPADYKR
jgi:hypothetical protein